MTETETENGHKSQGDDLCAKVIRQIEYYFSDFNLTRDKFMQEVMKEDEGWIPLDTLLKFKRLAQLTTDSKEITSSVEKSTSGLLELNEEKNKIRRCHAFQPPDTDEFRQEQSKRTVYCKGFDKEKTGLDDLLSFFDQFDKVVNVCKRTWLDKKSNERNFKGSVFVTFADIASAEKFMALQEFKGPEGQELIRKWQLDYLDEKKKEMEERGRKTKDNKAGNQKAHKAVEKEQAATALELPKGSVLKLQGLGETVTREVIKEQLDLQFGVKSDQIAFIYYEKGNETAQLRFKVENAAKDLVEKMTKTLDKSDLIIEGSSVTFSLLQGQEESDFLSQCALDIRSMKGKQKGHKRRGQASEAFRGKRRKY